MREEIVIKVADVLEPESAPFRNGPVFLHIKDGRFANVTSDAGSVPAGIPLLDEADKFAIPGLIDMHVHMARSEPGADINLAPLYLLHGVTTVRDVGSDLEAIKRMKLTIEEGTVPGPRIIFCGPQLNGKSFRPGMVNIQTNAEAREQVRELKRQGVHAIKVYDQLHPELARSAIQEARELGLPVCGHLGKTSASEAIGYGINGLEHLTSLIFELLDQEQPNPFSQDIFRRIAELELSGPGVQNLSEQVVNNGVYIDPTLVVYDRIARAGKNWDSECEPVPETLARYWSSRMGGFTKTWLAADFAAAGAAFEKLKQLLKRLHEAGVQIIAGTDTPNPYLVPGRSLVEEINFLAEAGLSAREAIVAATIRAAEALGMEDEIGKIEEGALADFVLLASSPLDDLASIKQVHAVFKSGVRYTPYELRRITAN
jgi:imidazolonepropionase-like amidohydrolase